MTESTSASDGPAQAQYEAGLRQRLALLKKHAEDGKLVLGHNSHLIESLKAVCCNSDGEIDLTSVNSSVRALAAAVGTMQHREDVKKVVSLSDLQHGYFDAIQNAVGPLYKQMKKRRLTPEQIERAVDSDPEAPRQLGKIAAKLCDWSLDLWKDASEPAYVHVSDISSLKGVFGGEVFPQGKRNLASYAGVYTDTIVLPDPFLRIAPLFQRDRNEMLGQVIKCAMQLLEYREAALAELSVPLVVVVPDEFAFDENRRQRVLSSAQKSGLAHINAVFGTTFETFDEAFASLGRYASTADFVAQVRDKKRLLFHEGDERPLVEQIDEYVKNYVLPFNKLNVGEAIAINAMSRMAQATDLHIKSMQLKGTPLIDAPTSWRYYNWKLAYDAGVAHTGTDQGLLHLHMTRALGNAATGELQWLGAVPIKSLVEMRKQGAMPELRSVLSSGVEELMKLRPENFFRSGDQVIENIQNAFTDHQKKLATLTGKRWRFAGIELGSCIVKGSIQIASACGIPLVSLAGAALDQAVDVPKLKDLPKKFKALMEEEKAVKSSAVGLLFNASSAAQNSSRRE
jgi:hypothetical protein